MDDISNDNNGGNDETPQKRKLGETIISKLRSDKSNKLILYHLIPISIFLILAIFMFRNIIGVKGVIIQGDFTYPPDLDRFFKFFYPMWDDTTGVGALARLPRLLYYLPFFAVGFAFDLDTTEMLTMVFIFAEFLSGFSMYYASRYLLKKVYQVNEFKISIASFIAAMSYMWSIYLIFNSFYPHHRAAYSLMPFIVLSLITGLEKGKLRYFILTGFLWSVACMDMHLTVHVGILSVSIIVFYFFLNAVKPNEKGILKGFLGSFLIHAKYLIALIISFICFSGYWFIPGLLMGGTSRYQSIIFEESSEIFYTRSTMFNMMSNQASHFQDSIIFSTYPEYLDSTGMQNMMVIMGLGVFIFGMMALYLKPKNRYVTFFSIFAIMSIFLAAMPIFSNDLYVWFVNKAPLHNWYGWAFKWPIISQFVVLSVSFLLGFSLIEVFIRVDNMKSGNINIKKGLTISLICLLLISIILPKWPLATGDMNGWFMPAEMPNEFDQVNAWLEEQEGDFKVLWLPKYRTLDADWYPNHKISKDIAGFTSSKPTYVFWSPQKQPNGYGLYFFASTIFHLHDLAMLLSNASNDFGKLLSPLGIKYLIFHDDNALAWSERNQIKSDQILNNIRSQDDFILVKEFGFIYVFENKYYDEQAESLFYTTSNDFLIYGGLVSLGTLNSVTEFQPLENGLIFGSQKRYGLEDLMDITDGVIFTKSSGLEEIVFTFLDDKYFIVPFDFTNNIAAYETWSKAKFNHLGNVPVYRKGNMDEWDRDYDEGIVYTWSPGTVKTSTAPDNDDLLLHFDFEEGVEDFFTQTSSISLSLSNNSANGQRSLLGMVTRSENKETQIASSEMIPVSSLSNNHRVSLYLAAENGSNVQVKLRFFDSDKAVQGRYFIMTESGSFDYTRYEQDVVFPPGTAYYSIQILADQNSISDSYFWIDDMRLYTLEDVTIPNRLSMDFIVDNTDVYEIYVRSYLSESGGKMNILMDGELLVSHNTLDKPNTFVWNKIASTRINQGTHTMAIDNVVGFNAVNLIAVVPKNKMDQYLGDAEGLLSDREVIYVLEPESDFSYKNATIFNGYGSMASLGEILRLGSNGEARLPIKILKAGNYSLSLGFGGKGRYHMNVNLGENSSDLKYNSIKDFSWYNISGLELFQGDQELIFTIPDETVVYRLSFEEGWNTTTNTPESWLPPRPQYSGSLNSSIHTHGNYSLMLTTDTAVTGWSRMNSNNFTVDTDIYYRTSIDIRTENVNDTRISIHGFNTSSGAWEKLGTLVDGLDGTQDWAEYWETFFVPEYISNITVVLNMGQILNTSENNATVWFDNFKLEEDKSKFVNEIDLVVLSSNEEGGVLEEIFAPNEDSRVVDYKKIGGTKYEVKVSTESPFMLAFAEAYDEFWVARIEGQDEEIESIPLYSMLNGFYITKTGNFTVIIEYKPQQWFNIGATITGMSMVGSLGYFIWVDRRMWGNRLNVLYRQLERLVRVFRRKPK